MKVVISCTAFEGYHAKVIDHIARAIKALSAQTGVPIDVFPDLSCRDAEMRFAAWMQLADERREQSG